MRYPDQLYCLYILIINASIYNEKATLPGKNVVNANLYEYVHYWRVPTEALYRPPPSRPSDNFTMVRCLETRVKLKRMACFVCPRRVPSRDLHITRKGKSVVYTVYSTQRPTIA